MARTRPAARLPLNRRQTAGRDRRCPHGDVHGRPQRLLRRDCRAARRSARPRSRYRGRGARALRAGVAGPGGGEGLLPRYGPVEGGRHARARARRPPDARSLRSPDRGVMMHLVPPARRPRALAALAVAPFLALSMSFSVPAIGVGSVAIAASTASCADALTSAPTGPATVSAT